MTTQPWAVAAVSAMALTACCPAAAPLRPVVEIPTLPPLPVVKAEELSCLSPAVWERLVTRSLIVEGTLAECQAVLEEIVDDGN